MRKTAICDLLGIEYPVIQGGMAWVAEHNLAAAVSNAGGLGIIAAANAPYEYVRDEIRKTKELTDRPFGVNIMLLSPHAEDVARVVVEEKVPVVTTGAGNPGTYMKQWKEAGIKVIPVVASVALAKLMRSALPLRCHNPHPRQRLLFAVRRPSAMPPAQGHRLRRECGFSSW